MNTKTASLITLVWFILQGLYLLTIALDAGTFAALNSPTIKTTATSFILWNSLTLLLYTLIEKPTIKKKYLLLVVIFIGLFIVFQLVFTVTINLLSNFYNGNSIPGITEIFLNKPFIVYYIHFTQYIFLFCMCLGFIHNKNATQIKLKAIELEKKAANAELSKSEMKMQVLQTQLSPHFLFNSLNSISGLIRIDDKSKSLDSISSLGDLLRFSLNASSSSFISLVEEIEFTNHYIDLQQLRFDEFFSFKLTYDESMNQLLCPPFLLQTLIENTFTHAVANKKSIIHIHAKITKSKNHLDFIIENTLPNDDKRVKSGNGLAIKNLESRLGLLYCGDFFIEQNTRENTFTAKVQIPLLESIYDLNSELVTHEIL